MGRETAGTMVKWLLPRRHPDQLVVLVVLVIASLALLCYLLPVTYLRSSLTFARSSTFDAEDNTILIFNRIPKTASTTLMHIPYNLCTQNKYHVILVDVNRSQHSFGFKDEVEFGRNISLWHERRPAVFHGHFAFVDFDRIAGASPGLDRPPVYINLIRRPLDRLVSYYYFLRYGDDFRQDKIRSKMGDTVSFDDCVKMRLPDCSPKKLWLQIPWFCGSFKKCWEPGNRWALEQAKHNLVHKYFLVGLTEDLETFIRLLELTLPRFFDGAIELYLNAGESQHIRRTKHKLEPDRDTVAAIEESKIWKMENEFYEFAASHFQSLRLEFETSKGKTLFRYEKIRPRD